MSNFFFWFVGVVMLAVCAFGITMSIKQSSACADRGGVMVKGYCIDRAALR